MGYRYGKKINQSKVHMKSKFEKTREYLKLNFKYPEFSIGFQRALLARCGYKFYVRVAKAAKMIEKDCPERCPCCYRKNSNPRLVHWFSKCYLFREISNEILQGYRNSLLKILYNF